MVKPTRGAIAGYAPGPVPTSAEDIPRYLDDELNRMAGLFTALLAPQPSFRLSPMAAPPAAPMAGMIVYTDGTAWDPGSGEGYYYYNRAGVWTPLG